MKPQPPGGIQDNYSLLATNIPLFKDINQLPMIFGPSRLGEGDDVVETLCRNQAKYHKSCRFLFNNTKLQRAQKKKTSSDSQRDESCSKI